MKYNFIFPSRFFQTDPGKDARIGRSFEHIIIFSCEHFECRHKNLSYRKGMIANKTIKWVIISKFVY